MRGLRQIRRSLKLAKRRYRQFRTDREFARAVGPVRSSLTLPDFLIIGAPKCATSWLSMALAEHPEIVMVRKEIEYFSDHFDRSLASYAARFAEDSPFLDRRNLDYRKPYADCAVGEKSAGYCAMPPARIRQLHSLLPEARLLLMTRDPVERHWAHAKRYFSKRGVDAATMPESELFAFFESTRRFGEVSRIIEDWTSVFRPEQLLTLRQEDASVDPERVFRRALGHIGVSTEHEPARNKTLYKRKNKGPKIAMPRRVADHLEQLFAPELARLPRSLPNDAMAGEVSSRPRPPVGATARG